jgi:hypothetical protein
MLSKGIYHRLLALPVWLVRFSQQRLLDIRPGVQREGDILFLLVEVV